MNTKDVLYALRTRSGLSQDALAEKLFVTQSSLSQTLAHVEKELGIKIFNRTGSELTPTYEGELFLQSCRQILEIRNNLQIQYREIHQNYTGLLKIGIAPQRSNSVFFEHFIYFINRILSTGS